MTPLEPPPWKGLENSGAPREILPQNGAVDSTEFYARHTRCICHKSPKEKGLLEGDVLCVAKQQANRHSAAAGTLLGKNPEDAVRPLDVTFHEALLLERSNYVFSVQRKS